MDNIKENSKLIIAELQTLALKIDAICQSGTGDFKMLSDICRELILMRGVVDEAINEVMRVLISKIAQ